MPFGDVNAPVPMTLPRRTSSTNDGALYGRQSLPCPDRRSGGFGRCPAKGNGGAAPAAERRSGSRHGSLLHELVRPPTQATLATSGVGHSCGTRNNEREITPTTVFPAEC